MASKTRTPRTEKRTKPAELSDTFRANMRAIREEVGLSQSELARRLGRKPSYICDLENARRPKVSLKTVAIIAEGLGVAPFALLLTKKKRR